MQFDFSIPDHPTYSFLYPEDLKFFYYDINFAKDCGILEEDSWEKVMKEFNEKTDITVCEKIVIPSEVLPNTIRFTKRNNELEIDAFFRHLRNAFAHYRIHRIGDSFYIEDRNRRHNITAIGKIECKLLKEICFKYSDSTNPLMESL